AAQPRPVAGSRGSPAAGNTGSPAPRSSYGSWNGDGSSRSPSPAPRRLRRSASFSVSWCLSFSGRGTGTPVCAPTTGCDRELGDGTKPQGIKRGGRLVLLPPHHSVARARRRTDSAHSSVRTVGL